MLNLIMVHEYDLSQDKYHLLKRDPIAARREVLCQHWWYRRYYILLIHLLNSREL